MMNENIKQHKHENKHDTNEKELFDSAIIITPNGPGNGSRL